MQSWEEFQKFFEDLRQRKEALNDQKNVLIGQRDSLRTDYEDAVLLDEGVQEARDRMQDLENQISDLNDKINILETRAEQSKTVQELARKVHADCKKTLSGMRNNYISQAQKCIEARDKYLKEMSWLGEIARKAEKYSFFASEASRYLPEKIHVGLNADSFKECTLDENLVKQFYNSRK